LCFALPLVVFELQNSQRLNASCNSNESPFVLCCDAASSALPDALVLGVIVSVIVPASML
jgi:hypothetical protein